MSSVEGLFSTSAGSVAAVALLLSVLALGAVAVLLARQERLIGRYKHFMEGTSGGNLEVALVEHVGRVRETADKVRELEKLAKGLEQTQRRGFQHLGVVRFNPFRDTGGDQSFCVALADGYGNGVVLSSLHSRGVARMYAKPLQQWVSTYSLSDEEKQAIELASRSG